MSLYRFFESYIEETPELLNLHSYNSYSNFFDYLTYKQTRTTFQKYFDVLLYDKISTFSKNLQEYEILKIKTKELSNATQLLFEKEKH